MIIGNDLSPRCSPNLFTVFNNMAITRSVFYGPSVWRFFHTTAEIMAQHASDAPGAAMLEAFKKFLPLFGAMHPCPRCQENFLINLQSADLHHYSGNTAIRDMTSRNWTNTRGWKTTSDKVLMYPIEWLVLARARPRDGEPPYHVMGCDIRSDSNPLDGWKAAEMLGNPRKQSVQTRLDTLKSPADLRVFLWKLHNAMDATLNSKY